MDKVRIAAIQAFYDETENGHANNMAYVRKKLLEARDGGALIACFPELIPGPWKPPQRYEETLADMAVYTHEAGIYCVFGVAKPVPGDEAHQYVTEVLMAPNGTITGEYERHLPPGPWFMRGGEHVDINYKSATTPLPVFDTELGKIAMLVCSETYVPELSRILALKGAEIVFLPAGINKYDLIATWPTMIRARAMENLMYTVTCQGMCAGEVDDGLAMIAGPEGELVESRREGIIYMDADLARARYLRSTIDSVTGRSMGYKVKPGALTQWRNVKLFKELLMEPDFL